jgi:hypothetical protein
MQETTATAIELFGHGYISKWFSRYCERQNQRSNLQRPELRRERPGLLPSGEETACVSWSMLSLKGTPENSGVFDVPSLERMSVSSGPTRRGRARAWGDVRDRHIASSAR